MRQFYLLISFVLIAASLLSGGVLPCDSAFASIVVTAVTTDIHVTNFADGEIINYDLPLLKGTAQGSDSISITTGNSTLNWSVREGRWRAFVPLQVGENIIILTSSSGNSTSLKLTYRPQRNEKLVRLVYVLGSDSAGNFDAPIGAPNGLSNAVSRLQLAGRMLQSITAELLYEKGLPRQTFNLLHDENYNPVVDTPRSPLSINQLRSMDSFSLWSHYYSLFSSLPNRENIIDVTIIADTHFDVATGQVLAHAALGGGRLALFGSGTFYSLPDSLDEIESHFLDASPIESYLFPEVGRARQYWAAYTTTIGAILHELGHCFGLPHPTNPTPGDIMARGFDYLNRMVVTYEPGFGNINPAVDIMPRWTDDDAIALQSNPWFSTIAYNIYVYLPIATKNYLLIPGKIAFVSNRDGNWEIYTMNSDGTEQTRLTSNLTEDSSPAWSPDNSRIAFYSKRDGNPEIYIMNADGTGQTRLTNNPADDVHPTWSPDGRRIAFETNRDGNSEIYVMNADGTSQTRLTYNSWPDGGPSWSPDGSKIAYISFQNGNYDIYLMNSDGTGQIRLTNTSGNEYDPSWSPDSSKIVFESTRDGTSEIYTMNANGTNQTRLTYNTSYDAYPAWSPDGLRIAFMSDWEIYSMNMDGTRLINLSNNPAADWAPDWSWP